MNWKGFCRFCCRTIFRILSVILLIGLIVFLYLGIHGVPRRYADRLLDKLHSTGYIVTVERLRLNLIEGIVVDNLCVFADENRLQPMLEAKLVALFINPLDWLRGKTGAGQLPSAAASTAQTLDNLHGRLTLTQAEVMGVWLEKGSVGFVIQEGKVNLVPIVVRLGKDHQQGKLQGHFSYNLDSGDYEGRVEASLNPCLLTPTLNSNQAEMVNSFVFRGPPVAVEADFSGRAGDDDALRAAGRVQGSNFTYQSVPVTLLTSRFDYTKGIIAFDAFRLVRPEGEITGRFEERFNDNIADLDLVSTVDPAAVAKLLGPEIAACLNGVHFGGPMRIAVRGRIDHGTGALTDIQAEADGSYLGYAPLDIDRCALKVTVKQFRIDLTDIQAELYEGTLSGRASFYPVGAITNFRYDVSARAADVNLGALLPSLGYKGNEEYEGLIYSECALSGFIGKERADTVSGGGWFRIQDGQLFQLRLLGGFARLLSILYPGLGTVSLTDFSANFTVKDRKIETPDAMLSGPTLAILGKGYYAFDETLDFIVWIQAPESKTLIPRLTKAPTSLLSKLLVVRLTGSVADPKWWPLNLTSEQLLLLPKDLVINMPKDVLKGLSKELLTNLPKEVLVVLPEKLFINLPNRFLKIFKPSSEQ